MRGKVVSLVFGVVAMMPVPGQGILQAQTCNCSDVLVQNQVTIIKNESATISYLWNLSKSEYETLSKDDKFGLRLGIADILKFGSDYTYDQFRQSLRTHCEDKNIRIDERNSVEEFHRTMPPEAIEAWTRCQLACASQFGLKCLQESANENSVVVTLIWSPDGAGQEPDKNGKVDLPSISIPVEAIIATGATLFVQGLDGPIKMGPNTRKSLTFKNRERGKPFTLTVNANQGASASLSVKPFTVVEQAKVGKARKTFTFNTKNRLNPVTNKLEGNGIDIPVGNGPNPQPLKAWHFNNPFPGKITKVRVNVLLDEPKRSAVLVEAAPDPMQPETLQFKLGAVALANNEETILVDVDVEYELPAKP